MKFIHTYILIAISMIVSVSEGVGQSKSFGNTYIHADGETVVFGQHEFDKGSVGSYPGIVGTERNTYIGGQYGIFGFSDQSRGWKGAADDQHVDGYVRYYGGDGFVFPIGDNDSYRPAAISGAEGTTAAYYGADPQSAVTDNLFGLLMPALPSSGPFHRDSVLNGVVGVSHLEYWDIDGDLPTKITLTWDIFSDVESIVSGDLDALTIVAWDGKKWVPIDSNIDLLYLRNSRSRPLYNAGLSNLVQGSITTTDPLRPNAYEAYTLGAIATGSIGDFVWEDMNRNGLQDVGEPGIENVKIILCDEDHNPIDSVYTDMFGRYLFQQVMPGRYTLNYRPADEGFISTRAILDNNNNSDVGFDGFTSPFRIDLNESLYSIDAGFYKNSTVGNFIWIDENRDGIQQPDEEGADLVNVRLYDGEGNTLASTFTSVSGEYLFTNLPPGDYRIGVLPPDNHGLGLLDASLDDDIDSDIDPITRLSDIFTLVSGDSITNIDAAIATPCNFSAEIEIFQPSCGESTGRLSVVPSVEQHYTFEWSTGDTTPTLDGLEAGDYTLIMSNDDNCLRIFQINLQNSDECNLICAQIETKVILEGTYMSDEGEMRTELNSYGYLPGQRPTTFLGKYTEPGHPYDEEPWFMVGEEGKNYKSLSVDENNKFYDRDVVDWVLVSLRRNINEEYEMCSRAGMLHADGTISLPSDDCCLVNPQHEYYIVIEHRNHLIVMSPTPMPVGTGGEIRFDFTDQQSYRRLLGYGQKELSPGLFAMYAANGDQYTVDGSSTDINVRDLTEWLRDNGLHSSYYRQDYDLNGDVNVQDKGIYLENIGIFSDVPKDR